MNLNKNLTLVELMSALKSANAQDKWTPENQYLAIKLLVKYIDFKVDKIKEDSQAVFKAKYLNEEAKWVDVSKDFPKDKKASQLKVEKPFFKKE